MQVQLAERKKKRIEHLNKFISKWKSSQKLKNICLVKKKCLGNQSINFFLLLWNAVRWFFLLAFFIGKKIKHIKKKCFDVPLHREMATAPWCANIPGLFCHTPGYFSANRHTETVAHIEHNGHFAAIGNVARVKLMVDFIAAAAANIIEIAVAIIKTTGLAALTHSWVGLRPTFQPQTGTDKRLTLLPPPTTNCCPMLSKPSL